MIREIRRSRGGAGEAAPHTRSPPPALPPDGERDPHPSYQRNPPVNRIHFNRCTLSFPTVFPSRHVGGSPTPPTAPSSPLLPASRLSPIFCHSVISGSPTATHAGPDHRTTTHADHIISVLLPAEGLRSAVRPPALRRGRRGARSQPAQPVPGHHRTGEARRRRAGGAHHPSCPGHLPGRGPTALRPGRRPGRRGLQRGRLQPGRRPERHDAPGRHPHHRALPGPRSHRRSARGPAPDGPGPARDGHRGQPRPARPGAPRRRHHRPGGRPPAHHRDPDVRRAARRPHRRRPPLGRPHGREPSSTTSPSSCSTRATACATRPWPCASATAPSPRSRWPPRCPR